MQNKMTDMMLSTEKINHYLQTLGCESSAVKSDQALATLSRLQLLHLSHYPFQSLSTVLHEIVDIDPDAIYQKLVIERRGGYCYEHNELLRQALVALDFDAVTLTGYIVHENNPATPKARTHTLLKVMVDGVSYLADVGFGGQVPTAPLKLELDIIQTTPHGEYRLSAFGEKWVLSVQIKGQWQMLYAFDLVPADRPLLEMGNWFVSTHPSSPFRTRLMASRIEPQGVRHSLLNTRYRRHEIGRASLSQEISSVDDLFELLTQTFGINTDHIYDKKPVLQQFLDQHIKSRASN